MTKKTKTCPSRDWYIRAKVINARFAEFSINSTDMKMMIALRRIRTPRIPIVNKIADKLIKY
jgi:hypothetical protein